jgi:dTDP-4-amino-4,6-dideoxygalactose transaminase
MDELQGAVLDAKLRHRDEWNASRRRHAVRYTELLSGANFDLLAERPGMSPCTTSSPSSRMPETTSSSTC